MCYWSYKPTTIQTNYCMQSSTQKLSSKYFNPYPILEKIGMVTYRLQLLPTAKIHDVFYVSQLKWYEGKAMQVQCDPPSFWKVRAKEPEAVLDRRMIKRGNQAITQVLIKWKEEDTMDATWEERIPSWWRRSFLSSTLWARLVLGEEGCQDPPMDPSKNRLVITIPEVIGWVLWWPGPFSLKPKNNSYWVKS